MPLADQWDCTYVGGPHNGMHTRVLASNLRAVVDLSLPGMREYAGTAKSWGKRQNRRRARYKLATKRIEPGEGMPGRATYLYEGVVDGLGAAIEEPPSLFA